MNAQQKVFFFVFVGSCVPSADACDSGATELVAFYLLNGNKFVLCVRMK